MPNENLSLPRALIVDLSADFGGANARVLGLMKSLPAEYIALATIKGSVIAAELEGAGYRVHYLASHKFDPRIPLRLARIIRRYGYQVVDTQNPQSKLWGSIGALLGGAALISTLNSWYMNEHPRYSLRWLVYSALEFATNFSLAGYIVVSREIQTAMLRAHIPPGKVDLIYNAVDLSPSQVTGDRARLLEKYHLPQNAVICLAAGRLVWAKAHENLVAAVAQARQTNPHVYCMIAGDGELRGELEEQIVRLGLQGNVILSGHLAHDDLLATLKACDIYVMPSRTEGTPVALLEAAALEKPIVASRVGGIPELVEDEEHALLVAVGDIHALTQAILRLASNPAFAIQLGQQARTRVLTRFSLAAQAQSTAEAYRRACASKG